MILRHLIQKLEYIGRQFSSADIPVVDEQWQDLEVNVEIVQDADNKYYIQITKI